MTDMMALVEPMLPALRRYARALLADRGEADDLVQDCLVRVIAGWPQRHGDDARSWVFAILHNLAVNRMRRTARRGVHVSIDDTEEAAFARPASQDDTLRHGELLAALKALPEAQRSVLLLVSVEDLSYAEAARVLDIPIGTVMSRLARAREKLAQMMETGLPLEREPPTKRPLLRRVK
jgi:RNA polymerase sigma factor (sigma-70 family)